MPRKTRYEDNPWPDLKDRAIADFEVVEDFLPSPEVLRQAEIRVDGEPVLMVPLSKKDMRSLQRRAKHEGVSSHALAAAVLHAFVDHAS